MDNLLHRVFFVIAAAAVAGTAVADEPYQFVDETAERLVAEATLGAADTALKRYAWGDLDQDGDADLVVVRTAAPAGSLDPLPNVLFMNEDGVLVDRTGVYAKASALPGDAGFFTPTGDTHVAVVDVDVDGWPDVVTATASPDGVPKGVSHPRVYVNLGGADGAWLGLRYEPDRIPEMHPTAGPRFEDLAVGDVTGDGLADLYFVDDDELGPESFDYDDRLLVNDGDGCFADETAVRLPAQFTGSDYGGDAEIGDLNGDSALDIIRLTDNFGSADLEIAYNSPAAPGVFELHDAGIPLGYTPYKMGTDDLNGDGMLDLVVIENDIDPYMLNTGVDEAGHAVMETHYFGSDFSYGRPILADVDNDGAPECVKAVMYNPVPSCNLGVHLFRNTGVEHAIFESAGMQGLDFGSVIGTRDVAVFDLDGDGWQDLILARCEGHSVLINGGPPCPSDLDGDGATGVQDFLMLLGDWGATDSPADLDGNGFVGIGDFLALLAAWGPCPE